MVSFQLQLLFTENQCPGSVGKARYRSQHWAYSVLDQGVSTCSSVIGSGALRASINCILEGIAALIRC